MKINELYEVTWSVAGRELKRRFFISKQDAEVFADEIKAAATILDTSWEISVEINRTTVYGDYNIMPTSMSVSVTNDVHIYTNKGKNK